MAYPRIGTDTRSPPQFEILGPEEGGAWDVQNRWFVPQHGFKVRLSKRQLEGEKLPN